MPPTADPFTSSVTWIEPFAELGRLTVVGMVADEADLRRFLDQSYARILRTVTFASDSRAAAEDSVHEAVARGWARRSEIEHFDRWVLTVALNLARSRWRRLLRTAVRGAVRPSASETDLATVEWLMVLGGLPPRQREVAVLRYVEDLPLAAIAEIVGSSEGAVKNALFHARRALAATFERDEIEEVAE